ncbi:MAG: DNA methyltransferase [Acidiferrobacterales bacterium]
MNLKKALLESLEAEQLKELCVELEVDADRRSRDSMADALASAKRAKPEHLIEKLNVAQLRSALGLLGEPTDGKKEELAERLHNSRNGSPSVVKYRISEMQAQDDGVADTAAQYRHRDQAVQRPDAGVQDQFQATRAPKTYRYDSSLDPVLSWDEKRERDLGEWLIGLIVRAGKEGEQAVFGEPQEWKGGGVRVTSIADAARLLQDITKPFLNWAGKAEQREIRVPTVPLFVHERHSTKAILDGIRHRKARGQTLDLFGDPHMDIRENHEAYEHKGPWQNRMILGDSLAVMNSLLEFEGLGGQVQMIYVDPPYGVKFGSNFQPFVRKRDVKHGGDEDMTREPEMVKAYRDTWELGLHSYLTYLRDRLMVARDLLHESGSIFLQISEDNLHHVREILDEVFGDNHCLTITFKKTTGAGSPSGRTDLPPVTTDYLLWYAKDRTRVKYRRLFQLKELGGEGATQYTNIDFNGERRPASPAELAEFPEGAKLFAHDNLTSQTGGPTTQFEVTFAGRKFFPRKGGWKTNEDGMRRLISANRLYVVGESLRYVRYFNDFPCNSVTGLWDDTVISGFADPKLYVVQTATKVAQRCLLMTTDPGDLVLDPTCGSGTTAYVAENWGRRWITCDTSRVPLALARQRLLTATFPYYELKSPRSGPQGGFVYKRKQNRKGEEIGGLVPHITLKSIANHEPPAMEVLVDRPEEVSGVTRVAGPFVVEATIAPVQPLETDGNTDSPGSEVATHIQRMTEVLRQSKTLHLPGNRELTLAGVRRTVDTEYLHAEAKEGDKRIAIVFGPQDGAVSASLVYEAAREAHFLKYDLLYFFGFAVEPNARSMIEEAKLRIPAAYVAVTPDVAMSDLLKTTRASEIFSVTGLPDFNIQKSKKKGPEGQPLYEVELKGLDLFDPESLETESVGGENVPCWMLDSDYDGLSFYATQVFFPKTSAWDNLQRSLSTTFDESVWSHLAGTVSEPFALGERKRVAVKVIDERGNELMRVRDVAE